MPAEPKRILNIKECILDMNPEGAVIPQYYFLFEDTI